MDERSTGTAWRAVWAAILLAGVLLVAFMITVEGEPGALPLALILLGAAGSVAAWRGRRR